MKKLKILLYFLFTSILIAGCGVNGQDIKEVLQGGPEPSEQAVGNNHNENDPEDQPIELIPGYEEEVQAEEPDNPYGDLSFVYDTTTDETGKKVINQPDELGVLVNKTQSLPEDYIPKNLVVPDVPFPFDGNDEKKHMQGVAAEALENLIGQASQEGLSIFAVSGYRSYSRQKSIYQYNVNRYGEEAANQVSAKPGESEHQTGLAMDVSCSSVGYGLEESFASTKEGQWLKENAYRFGFIIRYPKEKEQITGYVYEPWHIRYVGEDIASEIYAENLTLEEFYEMYAQ